MYWIQIYNPTLNRLMASSGDQLAMHSLNATDFNILHQLSNTVILASFIVQVVASVLTDIMRPTMIHFCSLHNLHMHCVDLWMFFFESPDRMEKARGNLGGDIFDYGVSFPGKILVSQNQVKTCYPLKQFYNRQLFHTYIGPAFPAVSCRLLCFVMLFVFIFMSVILKMCYLKH